MSKPVILNHYREIASRGETTWRRIIQRLRVSIGMLLALSLLLFSKPSMRSVLLGCSLAFIGLLIRAWAAGHIRKNAELAIHGPYAYCRNPLYFGSFLLGTGFTFASGVWWIGLVFIGYFFSVYIPVMQAEATDLAKLFGQGFQSYAASVPLFFPSLRNKSESVAQFDLILYRSHREYQVIIGFVLALAFLTARIIFA